MTKPILMAVHEHPRELATIQRELLGRYAADYEVIAEASASAALERLEALRGTADARVVVLLAAHAMTGMTGIEYLQRAHALHPRAQRVLLLPWGNRSAIKPIVKAISGGRSIATRPSPAALPTSGSITSSPSSSETGRSSSMRSPRW